MFSLTDPIWQRRTVSVSSPLLSQWDVWGKFSRRQGRFSAHLAQRDRIDFLLKLDETNGTIHNTGQLQVIGSRQPIVACPGDDIILPCHVEPQFSVVGLTVEWSKPDLKPDPRDRLSRVDYVYLYRDTQEVTDMQIPSYTRRTALFRDSLRHGNISLKITNVTLADEGRYRCFIPKLKSKTNYSIVRLVVEPNSTKTSTTETQMQPRHHPTPDPREETNGGSSTRSRLIPAVMFCVSLILFVGVTIYLTQKHNREEEELTEVPTV